MSQVAVNNQIWGFREIGKGKKTPILIMHGWGRNGNEWIKIATKLSEWSERKVYVLDLPGFGGSNLPQVKDIFEYTDLVREFCLYMKIQKALVIGHSLGGRVGIVLGARAPAMVERLILIAPAGVKTWSIKRLTLKILARLFVWVPKSIRQKLVGAMMDEDYRNSPALRNLYRAVVKDDLRNELGTINCRVNLIWGEMDRLIPLPLTKVYRKLLPHSNLRVVWGADHDPHLTKYDQILAILQESCE